MRIETVYPTTIDGLQLDGDLAIPEHRVAQAVLCHPHPLYGGDRFNGVIERLFQALPQAGITTLRFDFRGVNDSQGTHGDGNDERLDVAAGVEVLSAFDDVTPIWIVGYSFGALVGLDVTHPHVHGWVAIAPPLAMAGTARLAAGDHRIKHVIVPLHDQYSPPSASEPIVADWNNATLHVVESADHFLAGHFDVVADIAVAVIEGSPAPAAR